MTEADLVFGDITPEVIIANNKIDIPIFIFDTNVLLDYIKNRDKDVKNIVKKLIKISKKGILIIGTTIYNIFELLDKLIEIKLSENLLKKRLSADEITSCIKKREEYSRIINRQELNETDMKKEVLEEIKKIYQDFVIFLPSFDDSLINGEFAIIEEITIDKFIRSQDAMIISLVAKIQSLSKGVYLLTKDQHMANISGDYCNIVDPKKKESVESALKPFR